MPRSGTFVSQTAILEGLDKEELKQYQTELVGKINIVQSEITNTNKIRNSWCIGLFIKNYSKLPQNDAEYIAFLRTHLSKLMDALNEVNEFIKIV